MTLMPGESFEPILEDFSEHKEQVLRVALGMYKGTLEESLQARMLKATEREKFENELETVKELLG